MFATNSTTMANFNSPHPAVASPPPTYEASDNFKRSTKVRVATISNTATSRGGNNGNGSRTARNRFPSSMGLEYVILFLSGVLFVAPGIWFVVNGCWCLLGTGKGATPSSLSADYVGWVVFGIILISVGLGVYGILFRSILRRFKNSVQERKDIELGEYLPIWMTILKPRTKPVLVLTWTIPRSKIIYLPNLTFNPRGSRGVADWNTQGVRICYKR